LMALMVAALLIAARVVRLGFLADFLSRTGNCSPRPVGAAASRLTGLTDFGLDMGLRI